MCHVQASVSVMGGPESVLCVGVSLHYVQDSVCVAFLANYSPLKRLIASLPHASSHAWAHACACLGIFSGMPRHMPRHA